MVEGWGAKSEARLIVHVCPMIESAFRTILPSLFYLEAIALFRPYLWVDGLCEGLMDRIREQTDSVKAEKY